jgi:TolA-binding protein
MLSNRIRSSLKKAITSLRPICIAFIAIIGNCFISPLNAQETATTLQETLAAAQAALVAGDYTTAIKYFENIQTTFGEEPEVAEPSFQIVITPLHAYAALLAEDTAQAIGLFEKFIESFPEDRMRMPFVLYNLARAQQQSGDLTAAIESYRSFVSLDPNLPEAALASLAAADLMFEAGQVDDAFSTLRALQERQPSGLIRSKARLTALEKAIELEKELLARDLLLEESWQNSEMPELAILAINALKIGQAQLAAEDPDKAIACLRLVPPYESLIKAQKERLLTTQARFESKKSSVGLYAGGQFWTQFYQKLIVRLKQQVSALEQAEDYTASMYLSYGQAYLLAGRPQEAWVLFETLARDSGLPESIQSEAHYRWILAAIDIGVWEDAFRIAEGFGVRFPDSTLVPDALYLLASAYQEARQYRDAVKVLNHFLVAHNTHPLAARVLFLRGYNYNLLNEPTLARSDMDQFIADFPKHGLVLDAYFWRALTFFAERNYPSTLEALEELAFRVNGHRLEPEVAYRKAATLYAKKDYTSALLTIQNYLKTYPMHSKIEEGRVLLGDIQMGRGELSEARKIFASISPQAGHLFTYALFQTGKILRSLAGAEDRTESRASVLNIHREHFERYIAREDIPLQSKGRMSEALYWIGWTHLEEGSPEAARDVFTQALTRYGDDPAAAEVLNIIDALSRVEKRIVTSSRSQRKADLKAWIAEEKLAALAADRLTYFARLNLYLESMSKAEDSNSILFENVELVPIDRLDAESLGQLAAKLVERYPSVAEEYVEQLEEKFPDSAQRSYGYFARSVLLMNAQNYEEARAPLNRFRSEFPMHPQAIQVALRFAECATQTQRFDEARDALDALLRLKQAKGRPHAQALLALSRNEQAAGNIERAIPYAQRVYNVYRAYPQLAADAYWMSALQFEALGDARAAYETLNEMLTNQEIGGLAIASQARKKCESLRAILPVSDTIENESELQPETLSL